MAIDTKKIIDLLKKGKRPFLAEILKKVWDLPIEEYANCLWEKPSVLPTFEIALLEAFQTEFLRIGISKEATKPYLSSLNKTRVIQTSTHLTASEGPTFLALHNLALLRMPSEETYFVGAFSGVPFTNSAWSGCLNYSNRFELEDVIYREYSGFSDLIRSNADRSRDSTERRISLIPGTMRDSLVFQSKIPEKLVNMLPSFADPIRNVVPLAKIGGDFSSWAAKFCSNQLRQIIKNKSVLYFDINEVIRNYLLIVLKNTEHPIHCMFFNKKIRQRVFSNFPPDTPIFTVKVNQKNKIRHQSVILKNGLLQSQNYHLELSMEKIIQELEKGILCPGLFLVFTTLSFLNGLKCFGSFEQVEYLANFRLRWLKIDFLDKDIVRQANISSFTSGRCLDESKNVVYPIDLLLGFEWNFPEDVTMGELIEPLLSRIGIRI